MVVLVVADDAGGVVHESDAGSLPMGGAVLEEAVVHSILEVDEGAQESGAHELVGGAVPVVGGPGFLFVEPHGLKIINRQHQLSDSLQVDATHERVTVRVEYYRHHPALILFPHLHQAPCQLAHLPARQLDFHLQNLSSQETCSLTHLIFACILPHAH